MLSVAVYSISMTRNIQIIPRGSTAPARSDQYPDGSTFMHFILKTKQRSLVSITPEELTGSVHEADAI
jgi:hypothetical protein